MGRRISNTGTKNVTAEQKYGSSIGKRYLPLQEFMGRGPQGEMLGKTVWHDTHLNRTFDGGTGWDKPPPDLESGDQGRLPSYLPSSERYRHNFDKIDWGQ